MEWGYIQKTFPSLDPLSGAMLVGRVAHGSLESALSSVDVSFVWGGKRGKVAEKN